LPRALITGVTGQDGAYLSEFLLDKGYEVYGVVRRSSHLGIADHRLRWLGIAERVKIVDGNMIDLSSLLRIVERVQPSDAQRAGLEDLKNAAAKAADTLKSSCPTETALTPVGRLDIAERRFQAMRDAVNEVRAPLVMFYDSLTDQQKARFDVIDASREADRAARKGDASGARACGDSTEGIAALPIDRIERTVQPNDAQRAGLEDLRTASASAAELIKASCPSGTPLTAIGRLDAIEKRLDAMLGAIKTVRAPLEKFYGSLNDEQKARFNRMGLETQRAG